MPLQELQEQQELWNLWERIVCAIALTSNSFEARTFRAYDALPQWLSTDAVCRIQNGLTITMITMPISSSAGTSLKRRSARLDQRRLSRASFRVMETSITW